MLLTHRDSATIKHIVETRLESLPRVKVLDFRMKQSGGCLKIALLLDVDDLAIGVGSFFELPLVFDKSQLLNEIDEIAEGVKTARLEVLCTRMDPRMLSRQLPGTGIRGRWAMGKTHV